LIKIGSNNICVTHFFSC